ncbi:transposase [Streptomyces sp. NPDC002156]
MQSMGKKKPRPRCSFTPEFKAEIVELCRRGDRSVGLIAKDFDLTETAVRLWGSQAEVEAGERDGLTNSEAEKRDGHNVKRTCELLAGRAHSVPQERTTTVNSGARDPGSVAAQLALAYGHGEYASQAHQWGRLGADR